MVMVTQFVRPKTHEDKYWLTLVIDWS